MLDPHEAVGDVKGFGVAQPLLVQEVEADSSDDEHDPKEAQDGEDAQDRLPEVIGVGPTASIRAAHELVLWSIECLL
jgi:hypothetical protein